MKRKLILLLAAVMVFGFVQAASATSLMWVVENQSDQVFTVDVTTLQATLVGAAGVDVLFGGLGFDSGGTLYSWNTRTDSLYTVDQSTGAYTLVGPGTVFGADTFDINPITGEAIAWSVTGELHDVDLATGATSLRVNTSPTENGIASAFGTDGTYYQLDRYYDQLNIIDINTGAVTLVGNLGVNLLATNLAYNPDDDFLYTIDINDPLYPLYSIDPTTGVASFVGNITGLPNNPAQQITMGTFNVAAAVPEPATLLLLGTGLIGLVGLRRKFSK